MYLQKSVTFGCIGCMAISAIDAARKRVYNYLYVVCHIVASLVHALSYGIKIYPHGSLACGDALLKTLDLFA